VFGEHLEQPFRRVDSAFGTELRRAYFHLATVGSLDPPLHFDFFAEEVDIGDKSGGPNRGNIRSDVTVGQRHIATGPTYR
jgi:hypothetical protein